MSRNAPAQTAAEAAAPTGGVRALLGSQLRTVQRLVRKGLEIADARWRQATAQWTRPGPLNFDWLYAAHRQISRALRMAVFLELRLVAELKKAERHEAAGDGDPLQDVETPERPERLDSVERLDVFGPDPLRRYVMSRPVEELIVEICEGLGLAPDWLRLQEATGRAAETASALAPRPPRTCEQEPPSSRAPSPGAMKTAARSGPGRPSRPP